MLAKASALPADEVVIDLEDAVAASVKDEARADVVGALAGGRLGGRTVAVRINGLDTPWCHRDIVALADGPAAGAVTSLVIPKVRAPEDIAWVSRLLDVIGAGGRAIRLQALIETAAGLRRAGDIAQAGPRLEALILGYADLRASLGGRVAPRSCLTAGASRKRRFWWRLGPPACRRSTALICWWATPLACGHGRRMFARLATTESGRSIRASWIR